MVPCIAGYAVDGLGLQDLYADIGSLLADTVCNIDEVSRITAGFIDNQY